MSVQPQLRHPTLQSGPSGALEWKVVPNTLTCSPTLHPTSGGGWNGVVCPSVVLPCPSTCRLVSRPRHRLSTDVPTLPS